MHKYLIHVRVSGQSIKTNIDAYSVIHARLLAQWIYGMKNVLSTPRQINETSPIKPLTPDQARIQSMKDRVKRDQEAVKAERARQKIKAGQLELDRL